jgi:hypothetical protein
MLCHCYAPPNHHWRVAKSSARATVDRNPNREPNRPLLGATRATRRYLLLHHGQPLVPSSTDCSPTPTTHPRASPSPGATRRPLGLQHPAFLRPLTGMPPPPESFTIARPPWWASHHFLTLSEVPITGACTSTTASPATSHRAPVGKVDFPYFAMGQKSHMDWATLAGWARCMVDQPHCSNDIFHLPFELFKFISKLSLNFRNL